MAKRRANGEGSIRHRESDGRWEGRYTAGYDPDTGKRIAMGHKEDDHPDNGPTMTMGW